MASDVKNDVKESPPSPRDKRSGRKSIQSNMDAALNASPRKQPAPDINKVKRGVLEATRKELLGNPDAKKEEEEKRAASAARKERSDKLRQVHGGGETRMTLKVGGVERPIRLDTQETESDRLNSLVREVKLAALNEKNQEINRQAKSVSINQEVSRLQMDRVVLPMEVADSSPPSWRAVNVQKARRQPDNYMQFILPEKRRQHLNAIEKAAMNAVEAVELARRPPPQRHHATAQPAATASPSSTAPLAVLLEASAMGSSPRRTLASAASRTSRRATQSQALPSPKKGGP